MKQFTEGSGAVLIAVDYSGLAALAVAQGLDWARHHQSASVHFVHVAKASASSETERAAQKVELQQWLSKVLKTHGGVPATLPLSAHLVHGSPALAIVQLASDLLVDVVVLGTHGRSGVSRLVVGSVAEAVVRSCGCTVMVARQKEHHNPIAQIEPPCPRCVEARTASLGEKLWCEQHSEKHGRRHTYYNNRTDSWISHRIIS